MKLVLLPGLDGTGLLFAPFIDALANTIEPQVLTYPCESKLSYTALSDHVMRALPRKEAFVLLGESFSCPIAYHIALQAPANLKFVFFVAGFLANPRPLMLSLFKAQPWNTPRAQALPEWVLKTFLFDRQTDAAVITLFKQALSRVPIEVITSRLREIGALARPHRACDIHSCYLQARGDRLVPATCVSHFTRVMRDIKVQPIDGPHFILQSHPSEAANILAHEIALIENGIPQCEDPA